MSARALGAGFAFVILGVLSGCLGGNPAIIAPEKSLDPTLASLVGTVIDDAFAVVPGADVGILGKPNLVVTTDAEGRFVIGNLPGGSYALVAAKLGYSPGTRQVTVAEGERVEGIELILEAVPAPETMYSVPLIFEGYIACGFKVATVTVSNVNVCAWDTGHKPQFDFEVFGAQGFTAVLAELEWQPSSTATGNEITHYLWKNPNCIPSPCGPEVQYGGETSGSPLRAQYGSLAAPITKGIEKEGPTLLSSMTFVGSESLVVAQFQQRITHYIEVFYNSEPPEGYSGLPS